MAVVVSAGVCQSTLQSGSSEDLPEQQITHLKFSVQVHCGQGPVDVPQDRTAPAAPHACQLLTQDGLVL